MRRERHGWYSAGLGRQMDILVYGSYGYPLVVFPTSMGNEWEYEDREMIAAIADIIDAGRVKVFCVNSVNGDTWGSDTAHPRHKSWLQARYDDYMAQEVAPFIHHECRTPGIAITTTGSSMGAYHAVNTLLKHPELYRRTIAMSGAYDLRKFMAGEFDDNAYFNNPASYIPNLDDPWYLYHLGQCDIRLVTGTGPWEDSGPTYALADVLGAKGIHNWVDNWGAEGGHDWPYWKKMIREYVSQMF
jgi:esterase/lipase superfamily enzyme